MSESSSDSEGSAAAPAPAAASDDSAAAVDDLRCVWDGGKFVNEIDAHGKKIMKCLHGCGGVWKSWNHTTFRLWNWVSLCAFYIAMCWHIFIA